MSGLEVGVVAETLVQVGVKPGLARAQRSIGVIKLLKKLSLQPK